MMQHAEDGFEVAVITVAELWHGLARASGKHRDKRERYIRTPLEELPKIPYTETTALQHARIWAALESSGQMIADYDLIVAATAVGCGCALATFNRRHFPGARVEGNRTGLDGARFSRKKCSARSIPATHFGVKHDQYAFTPH
jgi:predicted nucleic acid-binding protein